MSNAGRPTWIAAKGSDNQGGNRMHTPSSRYSARDLASHTKLKIRQPGQNTSDEIKRRDLKRELEEKERKTSSDKTKKELPKSKEEDDEEEEEETLKLKDHEEWKDREGDEREGQSRKEIGEGEIQQKSHDEKTTKGGKNIDADDSDDSDQGGDEDGDASSSDDDEDEDEELLRELDRIKKEREQERLRKEMDKLEAEQHRKVNAADPMFAPTDYSLKRKWYDDVIFKNQARDEPEAKKRFINDTTRNDFARKFLAKYIK